MSLLDSLTSPWSNDKRSVQDCLRSKALPSPQVKAILETGTVNRQELKLSYYSVLSSYLGRLKDCAADNNTDSDKQQQQQQQKEESSLWHMERLATVIRFLQLLFEYKLGPEEDENAHPNNNNDIGISAAGDAEINKTILQLLQSLSGVVCTLLEAASSVSASDMDSSNDDDEDYNVYSSDASQSFDARCIACFVFGSLVRINHYVRQRPALLSPLYKSICDIGMQLQQVPFCLLNEAVKGLLDYLHEGTQPLLQSCAAQVALTTGHDNPAAGQQASAEAIAPAQVAFSIKVLGFLVARVTTLLKLTLSSEAVTSSAMAQVHGVLALLRGLGACGQSAWMLQHDHVTVLPDETAAFFKPYQQIAGKVERSVCALVWKREGDVEAETLFDTTTLQLLCKVQPDVLSWSTDDNNGGDDTKLEAVADPAVSLGKGLLLLRILQDTLDKDNAVWSQLDVDAVLRLSEDLMLHTLPACHASIISGSAVTMDMLSRTIKAVSRALLRCEVATPALATNVDPGRHRFHRLMVRWLSPPKGAATDLHPLTQEVVTTVVYLHVVSLCESDAQGLEAEPLLVLLVKVFFDARTNTGLRSNIAVVFRRVLASSMRCIGKRLEELLTDEFFTLEKIMTVDNAPDKKRKRATKGIGTKDLGVVCSLMSQLLSTRQGQAQADLMSLNLDPPAKRYALEAAIIRTVRSTSATDMVKFIKDFERLWKDETRHGDSRYMQRLAVLGTRVLELVFDCCDSSERQVPEDKVQDVCRLLRLCTEKRLLDGSTQNHQSALSLVFEATRVLGVVGKILSPSTPKPLLQNLAGSFHRLLSCALWPVRAFAMSSLVQFASTLPSVHKSVLLSCLPKETQPLLQCRLQSTVCGRNVSLGVTRVYCAKALSKSSKSRSADESMLPTSGSFSIPIGSYFMNMPTQEGRQAIVVFPPGHQSLEDIRFMLGVSDEGEQPSVKRLYKTVISQNGACKLSLRS